MPPWRWPFAITIHVYFSVMHVHMHVPGWTLLHTYRLGLMCRFLVFWPDPIHQPTHPPIHTPPMGGKFFRDFKSSNRIEISWLVQVLLNFYWFWGSTPWGVADGWMEVGVGLGVWGVSHTHMNACTCMLNMINMLNMDTSMLVAICNFYTCIHVCVCMCTHACACMWGHPPCHPIPQDNLPPTCPLPRATGTPKLQNSISPELIKIIWFCLKILYLWTLLNSYTL